MALNKFNLRFKQNRDRQFTNFSKCYDTQCFEEILGEEAIIDTILRIHSSPIRWYNPIQNLLSEFDHNVNTLIPIKVVDDSAHYNSYGVNVWTTTLGYDIRVHTQDRPLTEQELKIYGGNCIGEINSDRIFDRKQNIIYKPAKSVLNKLGLISLNNPEKSPEYSNNTTRMCNQFTPFSSLLTTRNSKNKRNIQADSFLGTIGIIDENNKAIPLRIPTTKYNIRKWTDNGDNKQGYYLTDCIVIIDIDNGTQIANILKALENMPFQPQLVITEKGVGNTKRGNTTAQFIFNRPITSEERKLFISAIRTYIAFEHNIYAIDSKATGIGLGKNPLYKYKGELTHNVYKLTCDNYDDSIDTALMLQWADEVTSTYEISHGVDLYMTHHKELMSSNISFEEILLQYAKNAENSIPETITESLWSPTVCVGMRNNTLVHKELPIYCLQYWITNGIDITTLHAEKIADNICQIIWYDIMQRYDNSDKSITWKYVYTRVLNCVKKDIQNILTKNEDFIKSLEYQRNIIVKSNSCRLLKLQNKEFSSDCIKLNIGNDRERKWTYTQSQRGGMVQMLRSTLYSVVEHKTVLNELSNEISQDYKEFAMNPVRGITFSDFQMQERTKISHIIRGISSNRNRQNTITNLVVCQASMLANKMIQPVVPRNVKLINSCSITEENTSLTGFSFVHSSAFVSKMLCGTKEYESELYSMTAKVINELFQWVYAHEHIKTFNDISAHHCAQFVQGLYAKYNIDTNITYTLLKTISQGYKNGHELKDVFRNIFIKELSIELVNSMTRSNDSEYSDLLQQDFREHSDDVGYYTRIFDIISNTIKLFEIDGSLSKNKIKDFLCVLFDEMRNIIKSHDLFELLANIFTRFKNKLLEKLVSIFIDSPIINRPPSVFILKSIVNCVQVSSAISCSI